MKIPALLLVLTTSALPFLGCTSAAKKPPAAPPPAAASGDGKSTVAADDEVDEYADTTIADPLEPLNRATFWLNHALYKVVFRPVSKGYETVVPKPVRRGLDNAFTNIRFPVRAVNDALQGRFQAAGLETGKFVVNTTLGVGGILRASDRFPAFADLPNAETGQTFAKWGIDHGFYLVLPVLGPSSARDTVGRAGDYVLDPITWVSFFYGGYTWFVAIPATNAVRVTPGQLRQYEAATDNSLDRYLALRSAYVQARREAARR